MLTKSAILQAVQSGAIECSPFDPENVGPNSLDLRLDTKLLVYEPDTIALDPRQKTPTREIIIPEEGYILEPGMGYLASTVERVGSKAFVPKIEGRSSLGRLFLAVHVTAGFGDLGFISPWTLELVVLSRHPVRVYPGMRIAQMAFHPVQGDIEHLYAGKYGKTGGLEASAAHLDREHTSESVAAS